MKIINTDQISTNLREDNTLEIYIDDKLAAEITDGKNDLDFVYDVLEGMDYKINDDSIKLRAMLSSERIYSFRQSQQISMQTDFIGYLRADFGSNGEEFFSTWNEFNKSLKTPEFSTDFDTVINILRFDERYGGVLKKRSSLAAHCYGNPDSAFETDHSREFGFRADTEKYSYLLRLNPNKGEYNFYCYCYEREALDRHMKQAEKGIRFITPWYSEKFRIPDGDKIRVTMPDDKYLDETCRYIDDYHVEVGRNLYHICQFAERMSDNGYTVIPLRSSLPEQCYALMPSGSEIIVIKKGESGYYPTNIPVINREDAQIIVDEYNGKLGVSKVQAEAMMAGSMCGWDVPGADPANYDKNGRFIPPKHKERGDTR